MPGSEKGLPLFGRFRTSEAVLCTRSSGGYDIDNLAVSSARSIVPKAMRPPTNASDYLDKSRVTSPGFHVADKTATV
jgi:hypothetical protein